MLAACAHPRGSGALNTEREMTEGSTVKLSEEGRVAGRKRAKASDGRRKGGFPEVDKLTTDFSPYTPI